MLAYRHGPPPPPRRHRDRRAGAASEQFREAFDSVTERSGVVLSSAQIRRQRERREFRSARRARQEKGIVRFEVVIAIGLAVLLVMFVAGAIGKLP